LGWPGVGVEPTMPLFGNAGLGADPGMLPLPTGATGAGYGTALPGLVPDTFDVESLLGACALAGGDV